MRRPVCPVGGGGFEPRGRRSPPSVCDVPPTRMEGRSNGVAHPRGSETRPPRRRAHDRACNVPCKSVHPPLVPIPRRFLAFGTFVAGARHFRRPVRKRGRTDPSTPPRVARARTRRRQEGLRPPGTHGPARYGWTSPGSDDAQEGIAARLCQAAREREGGSPSEREDVLRVGRGFSGLASSKTRKAMPRGGVGQDCALEWGCSRQ